MFVTSGFASAGLVPEYVPPEGICGQVTDGVTGYPLVNAYVTGGGASDYTDEDGYYWLEIHKGGRHLVTVSKAGFNTSQKTVYISSQTGYGVGDFQLGHVWGLWGYIMDDSGLRLGNQLVTVKWNPTLSTYSDANGFYYIQPPSQGYYYLNTYRPNHFIIVDWCIWFPSGGYVHEDLVLERDKLMNATVFAMFCTVGSGFITSLNFTTSQQTTTTVRAYAIGSSYTSTSTTSLQESWVVINKPCLVLKREVWITGIMGNLGNTQNGLVDCYVRAWTNTINAFDDISDYMNENQINPDAYPGTKAGRQGLTNGMGWAIARADTSSVSLQGGLTISLPISSLGINIQLGGALEAAESWSNQFTIYAKNISGIYKYVKWFLEGESSSGGMILHVWEDN